MTFKREERYYVLKISDMRKYLSREKFESVGAIAEKLNAGRAVDGKTVLQAVVVEHDWPEYEGVWQMIEARVKHAALNPNNERRFWPINLEPAEIVSPVIDGDTSDGHHTFNELYEFRKAYNIALFNEWAANGKCSVHKSWRHNDGELCFGGGWFIVVAVLPQGQISNHYEAKDWDLFQIQETEKALFEFDGHTGIDVIERLKMYTTPPQPKEPEQEPVAWPLMGYGNVAIGGAKQPDGTSCLIYLNMGETREIDVDTSDLFPIGTEAPEGKILACVRFKNGAAIQQTIDVLREMQVEIGYLTKIQPKKTEHEPCGEAYLCDSCKTPFDGAFQCPSCGHDCATKEPVYTTPKIPEGWRLVPINPTEEMLRAGADAWRSSLTQSEWWTAMLNASSTKG